MDPEHAHGQCVEQLGAAMDSNVNRSVPATLRHELLTKLRQYDTATAIAIIPHTVRAWQQKHPTFIAIPAEYADYDQAGSVRSLGSVFLYLLEHAQFHEGTRLAVVPQGTVTLSGYEQYELVGMQWAMQLAQFPVFEALATFALAVNDFLRTCDLVTLTRLERSDYDVINEVIKGWYYALGLY
jgi:hypothetical protein